jgi:hypothetical protein
VFQLARTTATQNSFPAGFLARILPQGPFPSFQTVGQLPFGFARNSGHRMHTAARPPRIFTVFPFQFIRPEAGPNRKAFSQHLKEQ